VQSPQRFPTPFGFNSAYDFGPFALGIFSQLLAAAAVEGGGEEEKEPS